MGSIGEEMDPFRLIGVTLLQSSPTWLSGTNKAPSTSSTDAHILTRSP